jgi:hypothetical protein
VLSIEIEAPARRKESPEIESVLIDESPRFGHTPSMVQHASAPDTAVNPGYAQKRFPISYTSFRDSEKPGWEKKRNYPADDGGPVELYDLSTDLEQKNNVAASNPEKVAELQALLCQIREQGFSVQR